MRGCSRFCRPFGRLFFVEISFDPQSLRDSPQGHAAVVFDAIGHLRSPGCARNNKKNTAFSGNGLVRGKADFTDVQNVQKRRFVREKANFPDESAFLFANLLRY